MDEYYFNVTRREGKGSIHFFRTGSTINSREDAMYVHRELVKRFPESDGFKVTSHVRRCYSTDVTF